MYTNLLQQYKDMFPRYPRARRPLVGSVIKEIRIDKGIRQDAFSQAASVNLSTLKSIENDHQRATTVENLNRFAGILGVTPEELILSGREWDPANYFAIKKTSPQRIAGMRKWKRVPEAWTQCFRLSYRGVDFAPISPPIAAKKDFFFCRLQIPPKGKLGPLKLPFPQPVIGFINQGFGLKIYYAGRVESLTSHQGFMLDGFYPHSIHNEDEEQEAVLYLLTRIIIPGTQKRLRSKDTNGSSAFMNIAAGVEKLRQQCSGRPETKVSIQHLADLTDTLDREQIRKMMRLKKGSSVVYWEKIEDLLGAAQTSMEDFLSWTQGKKQPPFSAATAKTRALIDYPAFGAKFYSAVPSGTGSQFFCGELTIEGKGTIKREDWRRRDNAMIGIYIEEGEVEIAVGKRRSALPLTKGESIYFDASLGYLIRNPGQNQTRAFFASCPGIPI